VTGGWRKQHNEELHNVQSSPSIQYNLGNLTYMGPRYRWITENDGLLEKVEKNLLSCTAQYRSFRIDYHLTEFIINYLFYVNKYVLRIFVH
jgi:hypothetical protein